MLLFTAAIMVILFVLQNQVDLFVDTPSTAKAFKIVLFVLAIVAVLFQRYG
jgi:hypothetical protein